MNLKLTMMASCLLAATFGNVRTQAQARYDMSVVQRERLNRGVVALKAGDGSVYITWRTLSTDKRGNPSTSTETARNSTTGHSLTGALSSPTTIRWRERPSMRLRAVPLPAASD